MIEEAYVSFEVAKLLKEKGFDEYCRYFYDCETPNTGYLSNKKYGESIHNSKVYDGRNLVACPTHQMAMAWLREVHNIIIEPESVWNGKEWEYLLFVVTPQNADSPYYEHNPYKSYEECIEAALKYVLENLI